MARILTESGSNNSDRLSDFLDRLSGVRSHSNGFQAHCPAHDDPNPSLSVRGEEDRILVYCFAGCNAKEIVRAMGLQMTDLFYDDGEVRIYGDEPEAVYVYTDENYQELYRKNRYANKRIRFEGDASRKVLYRLPELLEGVRAGKTIWIVEGEKDVETLRSLGEVATTSGGVGSWRPEFVRRFLDAEHVMVVADNDNPGFDHANEIVESLIDVAKVIHLTSPAEGKDITEHLEAGLPLPAIQRWSVNERTKRL